MDQLYMLEVLVQKIRFEQLPVPQKKDIVVQATCSNLANLEIRTDVMGGLQSVEAKERSARKKDIDIDCGRSVVFPIKPEDLRDTLITSPMEVSVSTKLAMDPIGTATIPWTMDFIEMVTTSEESQGYLTPVYTFNTYDIFNGEEDRGEITIFVRLSYLGRNVYTQIQRIPVKNDTGAPGADAAKYLFKSIDNATTFECQRFGTGSDTDVMPIAPIYNIVNTGFAKGAQRAPAGGGLGGRSKSTETIMSLQSTASRESVRPSVFNMGIGSKAGVEFNALLNSLVGEASLQQLTATRDAGLYLDLRDLHMEVSTFSTIAGAMGLHVWREEEQEAEGEEYGPTIMTDYKSLTVKDIERCLCKHPDCPAAKLFKNYGIGPLAKSINYKGVGGMYGDVDPPLTYGLSHANGNIDNYGPLGKFRRPKKPQDKFIPPNDKNNCPDSVPTNSNSASSSTKEESCSTPERSSEEKKAGKKNTSAKRTSKKGLKGGNNIILRLSAEDLYATDILILNDALQNWQRFTNFENRSSRPLRLRGGGIECEAVPSPFSLCQDLMQEFDKVLKEYKDALGPCGLSTCPFAMNYVNETCHSLCNANSKNLEQICDLLNPDKILDNPQTDEFAGCGLSSCPYKRAVINPADEDHKQVQSRPGCGNPNCPFVKAKLGLDPDDDCGGPVFKDYQQQKLYKHGDKLPPIHWDCPDPLPKGDCRNPDCPFVKRDALIKKYFPDPCDCSPCGNANCPYVCAPCTFPGCPFGAFERCPPTCPYVESPPEELNCTESTCPFARAPMMCQSADCPYRKMQMKLENEMHEKLSVEEAEGEEKEMYSKCPDETTSKPCVLAAAALEVDNDTCDKDTCGTDKFICKECRLSVKSEKSVKSDKVNVKSEESKKWSDEKMVDKKSIGKSSGLEKPSDTKNVYLKEVEELAKAEKVGKKVAEAIKNKLTVTAPKDSGVKSPYEKNCKRSPFTFDKKSYKPCNKVGHRECVMPRFLVPKDMGWLWNVHTDYCGLRPRRGWKPGAVSKRIANRIDYFNTKRGKTAKKKLKKKQAGEAPPMPTVHIEKKDGVVNVTMNPIKELKDIKIPKRGLPNAYMDCTPIKFKITGPKKEERLCHCGEPITDSEECSSELDIEFSPPAAYVNMDSLREMPKEAREVQYRIEDLPAGPKPSASETGWFDGFRHKIQKDFNGVFKNSIFGSFSFGGSLLSTCFSVKFDIGGSAVDEPLRLRGGGPSIDPQPKVSPKEACKDLMDEIEKVINEYRNALGPCGTPFCPFNNNVLEATCRRVCAPKDKDPICLEKFCPPAVGPCGKPLCPHLPKYSISEKDSEAEEIELSYVTCKDICGKDKKDFCGRSACPFNSTDPGCPAACHQDPNTNKTCSPPNNAKVQQKSGDCPMPCPYKRNDVTVDDKNANGKLKPQYGCGSPFCKHSRARNFPQPEIKMPTVPRSGKPCPSVDELPPIHWDCPDPLPKGDCSNPLCPLRPSKEKTPCICMQSLLNCDFPGCPFGADTAPIFKDCPPSCPYTSSPTNLNCTPSICPFVRPPDWTPANNLEVNCNKNPDGDNPDRTSKGDHCENKPDECSDPNCPYKEQRKRQKSKKKSEHTEIINTLVAPQNNGQLNDYNVTTKKSDELVSTKSNKVLSKTTFKNEVFVKNDNEVGKGDDGCKINSCIKFGGAVVCKKCKKRLEKEEELMKQGGPVAEKTRRKSQMRMNKVQKKKRQKKWGYVYDKGTYYPGVKFGHHDCTSRKQRVPWDMGWLWNVKPTYADGLRFRRNWHPGFIGTTILNKINEYRRKLGLRPRIIAESRFGHPVAKIKSLHGVFDSSTEDDLPTPKPLLTVKKKDGVVYVTMNPLKDPKTIEDNEYPYIDCSPMEFRITKKKKPDSQFKPCFCEGEENDTISSSRSSDLDIEFTPPAGLITAERLQKHRDVVHTDTQYYKADIVPSRVDSMGMAKEDTAKKGKKDQKKKKKKN